MAIRSRSDFAWLVGVVVLVSLFRWAACETTPAFADDTLVLPPGTVLQRPGHGPVTLDRTRFAVTRVVVDECRGCLKQEEQLERELAACVSDLERAAASPRPSLGTEWVMLGAGLAVGAAFAAGVWVGSL